MTRINAGVPVENLCDSHLLAEHKEIVRVRHLKKPKSIPPAFKLGTGHTIFFYDKMQYIYNRYKEIHRECLARGFNVQDFSSGLDRFKDAGNYTPTPQCKELIVARLKERLSGMGDLRYRSKKITLQQSFELLQGKQFL